ncbi:hypothetical protein [Hyphobacterium sp.]|uniref:hypothetical protein n=1 Tax=Hyphobacterium sp. TaxID=2004662 RepID=UPI003B51E961
MKRVMLLAVGLTGLAGCSTYDNPNSPLAGPTLPPGLQGQAAVRETRLINEDGEEVVCRTEPVVGSRIGQRICFTEAQWDQIREERTRLDDTSVNERLPGL